MAMQPSTRLDKLREQLATVQGQIAIEEEARRSRAREDQFADGPVRTDSR